MRVQAHDAIFIIAWHNHPSGDPQPSQSDVSLTKLLKYAGDVLKIKLLDHIIIGDEKFVSLKERMLM
jgi:DNA repair protein RadC